MRLHLVAAFAVCSLILRASDSPDGIINAYVQAVGGAAAIEKIETREVHARRGHSKLSYFWQKPNKVLLIDGKKKVGFDGGSGWIMSSKKHVSKLPKGEQIPLEMDVNSLRYARLKQLYSDLTVAKPENIDGREMDVLVAPNDRGETKFYFDRATHLLARIEETGESSAYFKHTTEFEEYKEQDGVKLPFRIVHDSTEPGAKTQEVKIADIKSNVPLEAQIFARPAGGAVILGGKR